jgi:hypothetical protein
VICSECEDFEFRRDRPLWWGMNQVLLLVLPKPKPSPFASLGLMWAAMLGGSQEPTHYERHREEYARTGDPLELERMLRQVSTPNQMADNLHLGDDTRHEAPGP